MSNVSSPVDSTPSPGDSRPSPPTDRTFRAARLIALIPGLVVGIAMIWSSSVVIAGQRYFTLLDDALISMTYARTLARTGELVWYPGAERVEGFTNPGYTLIMAVPHWLGLDASQACLVMSILGLATVLLTAFLAGGIANGLHASRLVASATALTVSCSFPLLYWSVFGLEAGMVAVLLTAMLVLALSAGAAGPSVGALTGMAGLAAMAVLVRPDAAVIAVVIYAWVVLQPSGSAEVPGRFVRALILGVGILGTAVVVTLTRWYYYGAITPNTYDLKMGNSTLADRFGRAWAVDTEAWWLLAAAALAALVLWLCSDAPRPRIVLLGAIAVVQVCYTFYIGGDTFHPDRFLTPVTLAVTVLVVPAVVVLPRRGVWAAIAAAIAVIGLAIVVWRLLPEPWSFGALLPLLVAAVLLVPAGDRLARVVPAFPLVLAVVALTALTAGNSIAGYRGWIHFGAALWPLDRLAIQRSLEFRDITQPEAVFGVFGAGAIPYWAERPAVDLLGKSDRVVARQERRGRFIPGHDKWDYQRSVIELQPDVVDADLLDPDSDALATFPARSGELAAIARLYERRCLSDGGAVLVRRDTTALDPSALDLCPVQTGSSTGPVSRVEEWRTSP